MNYLVVIEKGPNSFGAYVPDLPGVGVVGRSASEVKRLIRQAVEMHLEGLREDGVSIPAPSAQSHRVPVRVANARTSHRARSRPGPARRTTSARSR